MKILVEIDEASARLEELIDLAADCCADIDCRRGRDDGRGPEAGCRGTRHRAR